MTKKIVGAKYKLVKRHSVYNIGDIIYLVEDDGTDIPFFSFNKEDDRRTKWDNVHCVTMDKVVLFEEPKKQEAPTFNKGDKVRCITENGGDVRVGDIGISNGDGTFDFPNQTRWFNSSGSCVELVKEEAKADSKPRKKKILYPVGTDVAVRDTDNPSHCYVVAYHKGEKRPYEIGYRNVRDMRPSFRQHVGEIIRWENHPKNKQVDSHPQETAQTPVKSISTDDVAKLIKEEVDRLKAEFWQKELTYQELLGKMTEQLAVASKTAMCPPTILQATPKKAEKKSKMATIREQIRYATLSKDERILRESGILSENGNITEQGRRVVLDILFEDKDLRAQVVALVKKTLPKVEK